MKNAENAAKYAGGLSDDPFGRRQVGFGGADVGVEIVPRHAAEAQSQVLEQPLGDQAIGVWDRTLFRIETPVLQFRI